MATLSDLRKERENYWSQSRIGTFMLCSLKFAFSYVYRIPPEHTSSALPFGSAVHRTLEMVHLHRMEGKQMEAGESRDLFSEIWKRELEETEDIKFKGDQDVESCRTQGMDLVSVFESNIPEDEKVISVSEAMAVPLVAADGEILDEPLIGEADLVVERDGKPLVVDWKTAARKWSPNQAEAQLQPTAMLYSYKHTHGELPDFEYRIATKTKTPGYQTQLTSRTEDDFDRMVEKIRVVDRAIKAEAFMPNDGCWACGDCQFAGACKRWVQDRQKVTLRMAA
jgi:CRISPR/Cas system-associated exonuclease Cas4 (RecB family)